MLSCYSAHTLQDRLGQGAQQQACGRWSRRQTRPGSCQDGDRHDGVFPCGRANYDCNAWTWCYDKDGCTDELLSAIPYRGCQLKWDPHEPWGVPTQELAKGYAPSMYTTGYLKRERTSLQGLYQVSNTPVKCVQSNAGSANVDCKSNTS